MDQKEFAARGGRARARKLTKRERQEIGRKGGLASGVVRRKQAELKRIRKEKRKAQKKKPPE